MSKSTISTFKLFEIFPDAETARTYLEGRLWPNGVVCPECKGVWLDHGELEKIRETLHPRPQPPRLVKRTLEPERYAVCFDVMQQVHSLQVQPRI